MDFDYGENFRFLQSRLKKIYTNFANESLKEFNLTPGEIEVLTFLNNNSPKFNTASDIIKYKGVSKALVSKSVNSLVTRGLINANPNEKDKRIYNLFITNKADDIVVKLKKTNILFKDILFKDISERELEQFNEISLKMLKNLRSFE